MNTLIEWQPPCNISICLLYHLIAIPKCLLYHHSLLWATNGGFVLWLRIRFQNVVVTFVSCDMLLLLLYLTHLFWLLVIPIMVMQHKKVVFLYFDRGLSLLWCCNTKKLLLLLYLVICCCCFCILYFHYLCLCILSFGYPY